MSTNVYIDGLNLYHGAVKGTAYRWLDLRRLAEDLLPSDTIQDVYYFTAKLGTVKGQGARRQRQDVYLRAIDAFGGITTILGKHQPRGRSWEEKKTDVNIATTMIFDAFQGRCQHVVLISNDSDFVTPVQRIRDDLGLKVTVINPILNQSTHNELEDAASEVLDVEIKNLMVSQMPKKIRDNTGHLISKPHSW